MERNVVRTRRDTGAWCQTNEMARDSTEGLAKWPEGEKPLAGPMYHTSPTELRGEDE